jgi:hypothetical protein
MEKVTHHELVDRLSADVEKLGREYRCRHRVFDLADANVFSMSCEDWVSVLHVRPTEAGYSRIDIVGGGAKGVRAEPAVFKQWMLQSYSLNWGGPFAGMPYDDMGGTAIFGMKLALSSDVVSLQNGSLGFIAAMIRVIGESARLLSMDLISWAGGSLCYGVEGEDITLLVASNAGGTVR